MSGLKELAKGLGPRLPPVAHDLMLSGYFFFKSRRLHGAAFAATSAALADSERYDADRLRRLQSEGLQTLIAAASNTRYWQAQFRVHGIDPLRIRDVEDLHQLPLLEKEAVRQDPAAFVDGRRPLDSLILVGTSGTTGTPLRIFMAPEAEAIEEAFLNRQWRWSGFRQGDRRIRMRGDLVVPAGTETDRPWRYNFAEHELRMSGYHLQAGMVARYVDEINAFRPAGMIAYPSSAALLAHLVAERGLVCRIPRVFTSSESLSAGQLDAIERHLGAQVFDHYGNTELSTAIQQCERGRHHVIPEYGITELIPMPEDPSGEIREIVSTGFVNSAMPLLRYRTGDRVRVVTGDACSCGRAFPVVREVLGREDDFILSASGALVGRLDHVFKGVEHVIEAQIVQTAAGDVVVKLVPDARFSEAVATLLIKNMRARLGPLRITIERVDRVPRGANGKFRAVICERGVPVA